MEKAYNKIQFGKYMGRVISEIIEEDPDYLLWANKNVYGFDLNEYIIERCFEQKYKDIRFDIYGLCEEDYYQRELKQKQEKDK